MSVAALIVAAGRGTRAGATGNLPKQYLPLAGKSVLARSIDALAGHAAIDLAMVVIGPDDGAAYADAIAEVAPAARAKLVPPIFGGSTRQISVRHGLEALHAHAPSIVLIHDAARPLVQADVIANVVAALATSTGAVAAVPLADTLKRAGTRNCIAATVERAGLWRAQTPQGFRFAAIAAAHDRAHAAGLDNLTDDAAVAEWTGLDVVVVQGGERNIKLTTAEDMALAANLLAPARALETRTGTGFDVHRFASGTSVWLCGVEIPHSQRLEGHSDADVGLHALTDALLGAIGAGDIGQHFPPSDMRWKDAASHIFLAHAAGLVADMGGRIVNVDVTILAEAPRVSPHRAAMCARIAEILVIETGRVSVKATTTEGLGFTGRREGIAAMATASVALPAA